MTPRPSAQAHPFVPVFERSMQKCMYVTLLICSLVGMHAHERVRIVSEQLTTLRGALCSQRCPLERTDPILVPQYMIFIYYISDFCISFYLILVSRLMRFLYLYLSNIIVSFPEHHMLFDIDIITAISPLLFINCCMTSA